MPLWSRRPSVPEAVADSVVLERGERVLAVASTADGAHVVATDRAVWLPVHGRPRRIGWQAVDGAAWDRDEGLLSVVEAAELGERPFRHRIPVDEPGALVDVVREQVNAAIVVTRHVPIDGGRGVLVVGRRVKGRDRLSWTVAVDGGIDVAHPDVRARIDAALAETKSQVGE